MSRHARHARHAHERSWWHADKGEVHASVVRHVSHVENEQFDQFNRFAKLAYLYNPNRASDPLTRGGERSQVVENVIASNVDTVYSVIAATEVRARILTDGAGWSAQRAAKSLERYAEDLGKSLKVHQKCSRGFKDAALKGTGIVKVCVDKFDRIKVERVLVDDIIVDEREARSRAPRQIHQRRFVDREELAAMFPEHAYEIETSTHTQMGAGRLWADYRPLEENELVCVESWRLPIGVKGYDGYSPGRHTVTIDGLDLLDEKWEEDFFPFAVMKWSDDDIGWYGIGLAERIAGHQRTLNKSNWQINRQVDNICVPTTFVKLADAALTVKTINRVGSIVPIKDEVPTTIIPNAVGADQYRQRDYVKGGAFEESGVSRMAANAAKPSGIESGVALREYRDQTTQRFAQQEKAFERFCLDTSWLCLWAAKSLGSKAPVIVRRSKFGKNAITWSKVDLVEVKAQLYAASNLSRTPAGRMQLVLEWAQAGVISQDEARRLMEQPDTAHAMSLYTAAMEDIERCIEEVSEGEMLVPEPEQNMQMGIWRFTQSYHKAKADGAPEEILEALHQWITMAGWMIAQANRPAPAPAPMQMPIDPAMAQAGAMPPAMPQDGALMQGAGVTAANLLQ